jgi:hypothetical protein
MGHARLYRGAILSGARGAAVEERHGDSGCGNLVPWLETLEHDGRGDRHHLERADAVR